MTGSESIRDRIMKDAEAHAAKRLGDARAEAERILAEARLLREVAAQETDKRIAAEKEEQQKRNQAAVQAEQRKQVLGMRQAIVEKAFHQAADALTQLPSQDYARLLTGMLVQASWRGEAELVVTREDRGRLGDDWLAETSAVRTNLGLSGTLRYSDDVLQGSGGFVLRAGEMEINGTLPVLLAGLRPRLEQAVVKTLFPD